MFLFKIKAFHLKVWAADPKVRTFHIPVHLIARIIAPLMLHLEPFLTNLKTIQLIYCDLCLCLGIVRDKAKTLRSNGT